MYNVHKLSDMKNRLEDDYNKEYPINNIEKNDNSIYEFAKAGDALRSIGVQKRRPGVKIRKVIGVLFAAPSVPVAMTNVIPELNYLYHLTGLHFDIYCAGYSAYAPINENTIDSKKIKVEVNHVPWEFSDKAYYDLEKEIENVSTWKKGDGCTLLLFDVVIMNGEAKFIFDNCLDLNLKTMLEDKAITSVRKLVDNIVDSVKLNASTWKTSDSFVLNLLQGGLKKSLLNLLPDSMKETYEKAEHFAVRDLRKK